MCIIKDHPYCFISFRVSHLTHTLLQPVVLAVHVQDMGVMGEPVDQGCSQHGIRKELAPAGKFQVGGNRYAPSSISYGQLVKQQFSLRLGEGQVGQFVQDQQIYLLQRLFDWWVTREWENKKTQTKYSWHDSKLLGLRK